MNTQTIDLEPVVAISMKEGNTSSFMETMKSDTSTISTEQSDALIKKNKDAKVLENLLLEHSQRTKSIVAQKILANLSDYLPRYSYCFEPTE